MTPDEEYMYLWKKLDTIGNFFAWDVHPNVVRNAEMRRKKIRKKMADLVDSPEFKEYNPWYS